MSNSFKLDKKAIEYITKAKKSNTPRGEVAKRLMRDTGWKRTKAYEEVAKIFNANQVVIKQETENAAPKVIEKAIVKKQKEKTAKTAIVDKKGYVYNKDTDQYVVFTKKATTGKWVIPGSKVKAIRSEYTQGKSTITDISLKYSIPKDVLTDVFTKLSITHNSLPVTDEELETTPTDVLVAAALERKRTDFAQAYEKEKWKDVEVDARKWKEFECGTINPFKDLLKNWNPPAYVPCRQSILTPKASDRVFVVGAFDWHVGALVEGKHLINGGNWNMDLAKKAIEKYAQDIADRAGSDPFGFETCIVLLGGDLFQSITGYTANGTEIPVEVKGDTQLETIMNLLIFFVARLKEIFGRVEAHFVRGNHGGTYDIALGFMVKNYFRTDEDIEFTVYNSRHAAFIVRDVLIILDHGASDHTRAKVPTRAADRTKYITDVQYVHRHLMGKIKQTLYIIGDKHHYAQKEENTHEFIQVGALPAGDQYAEAKGYYTRSRQNCLILGKNGLESVQHFYFD